MYKILIADDEKIVRELIKKNLYASNLPIQSVISVENGKEALEKTRMERPDIIITDIVMPFMDGLEFLECLKQENIQVKTLIISGYDEFEYAKKAISLEVTEYLLKPFLPEELIEVLQKMIVRLQQENQIFYFSKKESGSVEEAVWLTEQYIEDNLHNAALSIDAAAEKVHFSVSYLRQIFKEITGKNINEFIIQKRMERAIKLLLTTDLKIQAIAENCGYDNQQYFASSFKKIYHCTPTQYKEKTLNKKEA